MKLHVIGSSSKGNGYVLEAKNAALIIECGVPLAEVKKKLDFDLSKIVGAICTHSHLDHIKYHRQYREAGICVYTSTGTQIGFQTLHNSKQLFSKVACDIGEFKVLPFDVQHDAPEPFGFMIFHPECGKVLFVTDTCYLKYKFEGLNNIIIECNYSEEIIDAKFEGKDNLMVKNRVLQSHMSLDTCKNVLKANDLSAVNNIVLVHLSGNNSHAEDFKKEIFDLTGKSIYIADRNVSIEFNKTPFE